MNFEAITAIIILSLSLLFCIFILVYLGFSYRNVAKQRDLLREKTWSRFSRSLYSLDNIFKNRTGLSAALIDLAEGRIPKLQYQSLSDEFIVDAIDELKSLFTDFTKSECHVSVKILFKEEDGEEPLIETIFRDRIGDMSRSEIYDEHEPFYPPQHSFIEKILTRTPFVPFCASNSLAHEFPDYRNPNPNWNKLFKSSAVHAICFPGETEVTNIFGFLCIDNPRGGLDDESVERIMSIVSTSIYYVMATSIALDERLENGVEVD